jgi:pimeloyl-ACP methyl ester carboxylesterase
MTETWTHREGRVNGIRLHWVEQGEGPLVVLLHGFPEFWYAWRRQIPALAAAGFRAVAPDLRGYNLSDKPAGVAAYRIETLLDDLAGLVELLGDGGEARAHIVGHDWGGALAWHLPLFHPEVCASVAILNAPHPVAYRRALKTNPDQRRRSRYVFFFQLPFLPERGMRRGNFAILERMLRRDPVRPGAFTEEDIRLYKEALGRPGALTSAINYYRAAFRYPPRTKGRRWPAGLPAFLVWGEKDRYLAPSLADGVEEWVPGIRVERLPEASHWVQNDAPDDVNRLLAGFFGALRP